MARTHSFPPRLLHGLCGLSSTWTRAQHVCKIRGSNVKRYLSSHVCCTPLSRDKRTAPTDHLGHFWRSRKQRRQLVPYPAGAWKWKTVQAFNRRISQLVNSLELTGLLNYLRPFPTRDEIISCRLFHACRGFTDRKRWIILFFFFSACAAC